MALNKIEASHSLKCFIFDFPLDTKKNLVSLFLESATCFISKLNL